MVDNLKNCQKKNSAAQEKVLTFEIFLNYANMTAEIFPKYMQFLLFKRYLH